MRKLLIALGVLIVASTARADLIANWTFANTNGSIASQVGSNLNANIDTGGSFNNLTRGSGAAASAANFSFRTTGFQNNGISVTNTDYFEVIMSAAPGFSLSLTNISAAFAGTASYFASPGADNQWAYSIDGGAFTLIGSPVNRTTAGTSAFDLSGTAPLQNITAASDVTLRFYATGQTTTGGWGFFSTGGTAVGLAFNGSVAAAIPEPSAMVLLGIGALAAVRFARRRKA